MLQQEIEDLLSKQVRPQLNSHGGDIELLDVTDDIVTVRLLGACSACPGNLQTMSEVVEEVIKEKYPQIKAVQAETGVSDELIQEALKFLKRGRPK